MQPVKAVWNILGIFSDFDHISRLFFCVCFFLSSFYRLQDYPMVVVTLVNYNGVAFPSGYSAPRALFGWRMPW